MNDGQKNLINNFVKEDLDNFIAKDFVQAFIKN
jgi:hypothetical protein